METTKLIEFEDVCPTAGLFDVHQTCSDGSDEFHFDENYIHYSISATGWLNQILTPNHI